MFEKLDTFVFKYSLKQQIIVVVLTLFSFPGLYLILEIPKLIINKALTDVKEVKQFYGWELSAFEYLTALCVGFLVLVIINGVIKMRVNTLKGVIAERLVRRLRYLMMENVFRFPLKRFEKTSQGEVNALVINETEPLSGYMGDVLALPLFQGGTMLTILLFMFVQNFWLGIASIALIPLQAYIIPKLQKQINDLKKQRVHKVRELSTVIGESIAGAGDIRVHGTQNFHLADFSKRFFALFKIRLEIFKKKFLMKFVNNFINQLTPFFFYLVGGFLVITGELSIGALVAALAAYKDLIPPWKELLNYYQIQQDAKIRYQQILDFFSDSDIDTKQKFAVEEQFDVPPNFNIRASNVVTLNDNNQPVVDGISFEIPHGKTTAIVGGVQFKRSHLAQALAGIRPVDKGQITIGNISVADLSFRAMSSFLGYQSSRPYMFNTSITENSIYSLYTRPPGTLEGYELEEAQLTGNNTYANDGEWTNFWDIGYRDYDHFFEWNLAVMRANGSYDIAYGRGLLEYFNPAERVEFADDIVQARKSIYTRLYDENLGHHVLRFDTNVYNPDQSVGENLIFCAVRHSAEVLELIDVCMVRHIVRKDGVFINGVREGLELLALMLRQAAIEGEKHSVLEMFELDDTKFDELKETWHKGKTKGIKALNEEQMWDIFNLWVRISPNTIGSHLVHFTTRIRIVEARKLLLDHCYEALTTHFRFLQEGKYNKGLNIIENLLFGHLDPHTGAEEVSKINKVVAEVLDEHNITNRMLMLLGESRTGIAGSRIPPVGQQRIPFTRELIKKPNILIINEGLNAFDSEEQVLMLKNTRKLLPGITIIWVDKKLPENFEFDQVIEI